MPKAAERRAGKVRARRTARFPRQSISHDEWQREVLELWLYTSLKMRQLAGGSDVGPHDGPPAVRHRRLRRRAA
jgi:hypothetical protein